MKRSLSVLLSAQLAMLGSWGCATVTTDVSRGRPAEAGVGAAGVRVVVFDRRSDAASGMPAPHPVASRLSRLEGKELVTVYESDASSWSLPELMPGKYVFAVTRWTDVNGKAHEEGAEEGFHVAAGEHVTIKAVLEDRRRNGAVTAAAVGGGAVVVYLVYSLVHSLSHMSLDFSGTSKR